MNALGHRFCPGCGHDLIADAPIVIDEWSTYGDGFPILYNGQALVLPPAQRQVIHTLMKAYPRVVKVDAILNRIGSEGSAQVIAVHTSRLKRTLLALGIPCPVMNLFGEGYTFRPNPGRTR